MSTGSSSKLTGAVGRRAPNIRADVGTVQSLVNANLYRLSPLQPLAVDKRVGPRTIVAIEEFQRRVLHMDPPDGRVDPAGATFKALVEGQHPNGVKRPAHVESFVQMALPAARKVRGKWKVPVSVLIAQAAVESAWGRVVKGNAYFGIKGVAPSGSSVKFATTEVIGGKTVGLVDQFRAYKDFDEAADDYGRMLSTNPLYARCFSHTNDPDGFADALQAAGYATDPNYAHKLKTIIRTYELSRFDQ